jgi:predicted alpha/beta hydrolase family esterase
MVKLERMLDDSVRDFPKTSESILKLSKGPVIFVAHSLGGIIVKRVRDRNSR